MPLMIARYPFSAEGVAELEALGFRKEEVWIKQGTGIPSELENEFWRMKNKPGQFAAFDFWGAGPD